MSGFTCGFVFSIATYPLLEDSCGLFIVFVAVAFHLSPLQR